MTKSRILKKKNDQVKIMLNEMLNVYVMLSHAKKIRSRSKCFLVV